MKGNYIRIGDIVGPSLEGLDASTAERLVVRRILAEDINEGLLVTSINGTEIVKAQSNEEQKATVLGLLLESGIIGESKKVLLFGNYLKTGLSFVLNDPIFLRLNGTMSNTPPELPTETHLTNIGHGNGLDSIFIDIQEPIGL